MNTTAIVPIKGFGGAKTRLSSRLDPAQRATVAEAMLADVLAALDRSERVERTIVVSREPRAIALAERCGLIVVGDDDSGHSEAAARGIESATRAGARCVALLPGDCPLLDPNELDAEIAATGNERVVVIADRHGSGTNGLILSPPDAIRPQFGPGSRERHERLAHAAGIAPAISSIESMRLDLDTPEDLAELSAILAEAPSRAPRTAAALAEIGEIPAPADVRGGR